MKCIICFFSLRTFVCCFFFLSFFVSFILTVCACAFFTFIPFRFDSYRVVLCFSYLCRIRRTLTHSHTLFLFCPVCTEHKFHQIKSILRMLLCPIRMYVVNDIQWIVWAFGFRQTVRIDILFDANELKNKKRHITNANSAYAKSKMNEKLNHVWEMDNRRANKRARMTSRRNTVQKM